MPIVNDLLTGDRGDGFRVFCMRCKHILRFRDRLIRATRSLGSSKKLIPSMPRGPKSLACQACQILWHTKISLWHALKLLSPAKIN